MTATLAGRRRAGTEAPLPSRLWLAPRREPPFDDECSELHVAGRHDRPLPFPVPRPARAHQAAATAARLPPDPARWGHRLLIGIIETAGGRRPLAQLSAMLSLAVATGLSAEFAQAARDGRAHWTHAATVRSVHASRPAEDVAELTATLRAGERIHAAALRLEVRQGRWRCTRLQLG